MCCGWGRSRHRGCFCCSSVRFVPDVVVVLLHVVLRIVLVVVVIVAVLVVAAAVLVCYCWARCRHRR